MASISRSLYSRKLTAKELDEQQHFEKMDKLTKPKRFSDEDDEPIQDKDLPKLLSSRFKDININVF
jgi:hypothetical protein